MKKIAIILFNLGGPDNCKSISNFLFNLFYDKSIINIPNPFRFIIAKIVSALRERKAKNIYENIGGKSPILENSLVQALRLEEKLNEKKEYIYKTFVSMRYSNPMMKDVIKDIEDYNPDEIILLPLYPQFSTTTTGSSFKNFYSVFYKSFLHNRVKVKEICCYHAEENFINAHIDLILPVYNEAKSFGNPRILFSAHGLPKKIIDQGDPYQWQIEKTVDILAKKLTISDYVVCYQSKVGPLEWISPFTIDQIKKACNDNLPIVIVPISFVSEHSETLFELDIEYKKIAHNIGNKHYYRVNALGINNFFIKNLAEICINEACKNDKYFCPSKFSKCPKRVRI